jgi:hypothetical protein
MAGVHEHMPIDPEEERGDNDPSLTIPATMPILYQSYQ